MLKITYPRLSLIAFCFLASSCPVFAAGNPYLGEWALTIPGGAAGWLGVLDRGGRLEAAIMWGSGSVEPVASAAVEADKLVVTREYSVERKDASGKKTKVTLTQTITATVQGDEMKLTSKKPHDDGQGEDVAEFTGQRQPAMPPAP